MLGEDIRTDHECTAALCRESVHVLKIMMRIRRNKINAAIVYEEPKYTLTGTF